MNCFIFKNNKINTIIASLYFENAGTINRKFKHLKKLTTNVMYKVIANSCYVSAYVIKIIYFVIKQIYIFILN